MWENFRSGIKLKSFSLMFYVCVFLYRLWCGRTVFFFRSASHQLVGHLPFWLVWVIVGLV